MGEFKGYAVGVWTVMKGGDGGGVGGGRPGGLHVSVGEDGGLGDWAEQRCVGVVIVGGEVEMKVVEGLG